MSTCYRLRSYDLSINGGYCYEQRWPGGIKKFGCAPLIEAMAKNVASWRQQNHQPRSSIRECLEDVDHFQCHRLGNNPRFCSPCDGNVQAVALGVSSPIVAPCRGCGGKMV